MRKIPGGNAHIVSDFKMDHTQLFFLYLLLGFGAIQGTRGAIWFTNLPNTVNVSENKVSGTHVFTFGVNSSPTPQSIKVEIVNSNPLTTAFQVSIQGAHGVVTVSGNPTLDFETGPNVFSLPILAMDSNGDRNLQILTVYLTDVDEPPVFWDNQPIIAYIPEGAPPGPVFQQMVFDPENKPLTFTMTPAHPAFIIDSATGYILSKETFDYETGPQSYTFQISVSDGVNVVNTTFMVYIVNTNDAKPVFNITSRMYKIAEELPPGTVAANITAVDPDGFNYIGYLLYSLSPNEYFAINKYTGAIYVVMRMDRDSKPLRDSPLVDVQVTVRDSPTGLHSSSITITFNVTDMNDNPPICHPGALRVQVPETEVTGALIASVTCQDIDVDPVYNNFTFKSLSCLNCNNMFALEPLGSRNIVLKGNLDFEDPNNLYVGNEYSLAVVAEDTASPYMTGTVYIYVTTIPVNEFPPVFHPTSYVFPVHESSGPGASIGVVNATDRDFPIVGIRYSFIAGGSMLGYSNIFWINPKSGSIQLLVQPDYEVTQQYVLVVQAVDGDPINPLTGTATVTVNIIQQNVNPPLCSPNGTILIIPMNLYPGTTIQDYMMTCTDLDSPPQAFRYSIQGNSNVNNHFSFTPTAGTNITRLVLKEAFDYSSGLDKLWAYKLTVLITDDNLLAGASQPKGLVQTGTIIINIQVVNPYLTTVITTTAPHITYVTRKENVYSPTAWYVPFIIALGAMLLLGLLGYLLYRLGRYLSTKDCSCCLPRAQKYKEPL
ncbi:cadherin-related family member 3 [Amia ocellicauda]|uniref:cadherin-related family member 3 n=1 Tax=Amia ocellicauda TaxID=2972642 RepID=UPI00346446D4